MYICISTYVLLCITLDAGPRLPLSLQFIDAKVYKGTSFIRKHSPWTLP